jgi:hypothetical protein
MKKTLLKVCIIKIHAKKEIHIKAKEKMQNYTSDFGRLLSMKICSKVPLISQKWIYGLLHGNLTPINPSSLFFFSKKNNQNPNYSI